MNLVRLIARPMLASYFVADGIDAVMKPAAHAEKFSKVTPALEKAGAPPVLSSDAVMLARVSGAVTAGAGVALALGKAPRTSATVLALMNIPITLLNAPVWERSTPDVKKENRRALLRGLGLGGGLLLAAADTAGKPSLGWRLRTGAEHRAALKDQRVALKAKYSE